MLLESQETDKIVDNCYLKGPEKIWAFCPLLHTYFSLILLEEVNAMQKRFTLWLVCAVLFTLAPYAAAQGKFRVARPSSFKPTVKVSQPALARPSFQPSVSVSNPSVRGAVRAQGTSAPVQSPVPATPHTWQAPTAAFPSQQLQHGVQQRINAVETQKRIGPAAGANNYVPPMPPTNTLQTLDFPEDDRPLTEIWGLNKLFISELEKFDGRLFEISDNLENIQNALAQGTQLTPQQFSRVQAAAIYFRSLSYKEVSDKKVWMSAEFRQHAAVLRSPLATEQAFFIEQGMYKESYSFDEVPQEKGYIPTFIGNANGDLPYQNIRNAFLVAERTDQPIFVKWTTHGEIDPAGNFYFLLGDPGSANRIYTKQVVQDLQLLRNVTGAPEINFQTDACHAGQFLDEFMALPENVRQGINVFVLAGGRMQVNNQGEELFNRVRDDKQTAKSQQLSYLLQHMGKNGNIFVRGYVNGHAFNPLEQAVKRAQMENSPLYAQLEPLLRVQNAATVKETKSVLLEYQFDGHGGWWPSFAGDGFDTQCLFAGLEQDIVNYVRATGQKILHGKPLYESLGEQWGLPSLSVNQLTPAHQQLVQVSKDLELIKSAATLTPDQRQRVQNAENYFRSLPLDEAVRFEVQLSAQFRQHAAVLRSPTATEYAYYIQGYQYEHLYKKQKSAEWEDLSEEEGYIPTVIGDPKNGCSLTEVTQAFKNATPTDKPIFVQVAAHGNVDQAGRFRLGLQKATVSTQELIAAVQRLRTQTGAPEVNVQLDSCLGGSCLIEFAQLPAQEREGINLFVLAGTHNYNYFDKETLAARSRGNENNSIALNLTGVLLRNIAEGKILAGAYINGKPFLPMTHLIHTQEPTSFEMELLYGVGLDQTSAGPSGPFVLKNLEEMQKKFKADKETYLRPVFNSALQLGHLFFGDAFDRMVKDENINL